MTPQPRFVIGETKENVVAHSGVEDPGLLRDVADLGGGEVRERETERERERGREREEREKERKRER